MDFHLPAVLVMGGGEGMGPVKETAIALGEALFDKKLGKPIGQIVVICGRNQFLQSSLQLIKWKVPVKVHHLHFHSSEVLLNFYRIISGKF